jgi:hypothetical protein
LDRRSVERREEIKERIKSGCQLDWIIEEFVIPKIHRATPSFIDENEIAAVVLGNWVRRLR